MAAHKAGLACWLGVLTLLWAMYPLLFSQARGFIVLAIMTTGLAAAGWLIGMQVLVVWSGGLGLFTLTLSLLTSAQPPSLWLGLSAGITLLALLDGSQRYAYLRFCQVQAGVLQAWLGVLLRLTGLSLAVGLGLALLLVSLGGQGDVALAGLLTIAGAILFVGSLAFLLLYVGRQPEG